MSMERRTKIVCTIGPASRELETLIRMGRAGMNVARLNFSHGALEEHAHFVKRLRLAGKRLGRSFGILQDLQGPRIRVGELPTTGIRLIPGHALVFTTAMSRAADDIPVTVETLHARVKKGTAILLDDGRMEVRVQRIEGRRIHTEVVRGGTLTSHKGMNIPGTDLRIEALTAKDRTDAVAGAKLGVDWAALSFVRSAKDILGLRRWLDRHGRTGKAVRIVAKIEKREAIDCLDEIIDAADAIMVARGDLGIETSLSEIPVLQKQIVEACRSRAVPVIVATELLSSMIRDSQPTRAEISDIANAAADHADAVMLSAESASGAHPVEAVSVMDAAIRSMEASRFDDLNPVPIPFPPRSAPEAVGATVRVLVEALGRPPIIVASASSRIAFEVSAFRPETAIHVLTSDAHLYRVLQLGWGLDPLLVPQTSTPSDMIRSGMLRLQKMKQLKKRQRVIVVSADSWKSFNTSPRVEIAHV